MMQGDVVVVTGAASGIGEATTKLLLDQGTNVIGLDLARPDSPPAQNLAWVEGDVAQPAAWTAVLETARTAFGAVPSGLVCNAATIRLGSVTDITIADWQKVFDVILLGAVLGMKACIPGMIEQGRGSIVTVGSVDAYMAEQGVAAYCSAKGALLQLTKCVALDYAPQGIRANCVCPGVTDTPFFRGGLTKLPDPEGRRREREQRNPLGRLLEAGEVASAIVFLCSDAASGMTGSVVTVDAGLAAGFEFNR